MMIFLVIINLIICFGFTIGVCPEGCNEPTLFYESLKCTPIFSSPDDCCPLKYDCSNIDEKVMDQTQNCYFQGRTYKIPESVNDDDTYGNCEVGCSCITDDETNRARFRCAILDCPEVSGERLKKGCHFFYKPGECCSVGQVCPPFNTTCQVGNETYHEGNTVEHPTEKCTECVCEEGFKLEEPFCKKRKCIDEVRYQEEVYSYCAPSFINIEDCCPYNWVCPEAAAELTPAETPSDEKCKFGKSLHDIGTKYSITKGKGKLSCECRIPPYMTCIQNYDYPTYARY